MRLKNKFILFIICVFASLAFVPSFVHAQSGSVSPEVVSVPHVVAGTDSQGKKCTSYWKWYVIHDVFFREYSKVEWTSNPCGFTIQDKSQCATGDGVYRFATPSGKVKGVKVWARSSCDVERENISAGLDRIRKNGVWSPWSTYWPSR